jgi:hypothetical protein
MKLIGLSCAMAGLLLAGCQRPVAQTDESENAAPNVAAAPAAAATPPAPPRPEYAPPGVFYLLAPVRKETKDGMIRLLPGTEVRLTRNGKYLTPNGEMALDPKILTNDAAQGRAARDADRLAQATTSAKGAAAAPAALAAVMVTTPKAQEGNSQSTPAQPVSNDANVRAIRFRLSVLKREESRLEANLTFLSDKTLHRRYTRESVPDGLNSTTQVTNWESVNNQLIQVRAEMESLENKLATASN